MVALEGSAGVPQPMETAPGWSPSTVLCGSSGAPADPVLPSHLGPQPLSWVLHSWAARSRFPSYSATAGRTPGRLRPHRRSTGEPRCLGPTPSPSASSWRVRLWRGRPNPPALPAVGSHGVSSSPVSRGLPGRPHPPRCRCQPSPIHRCWAGPLVGSWPARNPTLLLWVG